MKIPNMLIALILLDSFAYAQDASSLKSKKSEQDKIEKTTKKSISPYYPHKSFKKSDSSQTQVQIPTH